MIGQPISLWLAIRVKSCCDRHVAFLAECFWNHICTTFHDCPGEIVFTSSWGLFLGDLELDSRMSKLVVLHFGCCGHSAIVKVWILSSYRRKTLSCSANWSGKGKANSANGASCLDPGCILEMIVGTEFDSLRSQPALHLLEVDRWSDVYCGENRFVLLMVLASLWKFSLSDM